MIARLRLFAKTSEIWNGDNYLRRRLILTETADTMLLAHTLLDVWTGKKEMCDGVAGWNEILVLRTESVSGKNCLDSLAHTSTADSVMGTPRDLL